MSSVTGNAFTGTYFVTQQLVRLAANIFAQRKNSGATMESVIHERTFVIIIKIVQMDRTKTNVQMKKKCVRSKSTNMVHMDAVFHRFGDVI